MPVIGYQGHRPVYKHPLKSLAPPPKPSLTPQDLEALEAGIRRAAETGELSREPAPKPVVGYSGFMTGIKSECMFGETYSDLAGKSLALKQRR
jgi:hypothetical protein